MAMLLQPTIIARTWGDRAAPRDELAPKDNPFWPEAIAAIRRATRLPVRGRGLLGHGVGAAAGGFDHTYDKRLYDRLPGGPRGPVRGTCWPSCPSRITLQRSSRTTTSRGPRPTFRAAERTPGRGR
jgi:hypothetical protein